jgi:hypothetical protein
MPKNRTVSWRTWNQLAGGVEGACSAPAAQDYCCHSCRLAAILPLILGQVFLLTLAGLVGAQTAPAKYVPPAPVKLIRYNHKQHLALGLKCEACHQMPEAGTDGG